MKVILKQNKKQINESVFDIAMNNSDQTYRSAYTYNIISLSNNLSQPGNDLNMEQYINIGSYIEGYGYTDNDKHSGIIKRVIKDEEGYIKYFIILDDKNSKFTKISLDNIKILK